jgi:hypothetical protein
MVMPMLLMAGMAFAQKKEITGKVLDQATGLPLAGVSVTAGKDKKGSMTKEDGSFTISVAAGVKSISLTTSGGIFIGGNFQVLWQNGIYNQNISLLLPSGLVDQSFKSPFLDPSKILNKVLVQGNKVIVAGDFTAINTVKRGRIGRLSADGSVFEGGISATASVRLDQVSDTKIKKSLIGLKKEAVVNVDLQKAFDGNATIIAKVLNISEEDAQDLKSKFQLTVQNINRLEEGDLNQEFFDKIFGADVVKTEIL